ncbi:HIT domain-containing protein, partial [Acinetobacter baumannii]
SGLGNQLSGGCGRFHTFLHHARSELPFCKIIAGEIPSRKVYEDEEIFAFHDIHPWAPVHFLMVPKAHIPSMAQVTPGHAGLLGRM